MSHETKTRDNQTPLHIKLVESAITWMAYKASLRGFRATTEWGASGMYRPDLLAIMALQGAYAERYGLCRESGNQGKGLNLSPEQIAMITPNAVVVDYEPRIFLWEAKATRADFLHHFGKTESDRNKAPVVNFHWVVTPDGLVDPQELPPWWGLLELRGRGLSEIKKPRYCPLDQLEINRIGYEMLWAQESWHRKYECARMEEVFKKIQAAK